MLKLYPGIDALKEMVKNNVQEAINWAVENLPGYLYEKYSEYTLAEHKDYVAKYVQRAIQVLAKTLLMFMKNIWWSLRNFCMMQMTGSEWKHRKSSVF